MRSSLLIAGVLALLLIGCGDDGSEATGGQGGGTTTAGTATGAGPTSGPSTSQTGPSTTGSMTTATTGTGLPDGPSSDRLTLRPLGTVDGANMGYAEYLPPGYGDGGLRPLLLFHHGIGESGDGSEEQLDRLFNTGLPPLIENDEWPSDRPFIVLMTQHNAPPNTSCHSVEEITTFLDFAMQYYDVDPTRVYLTGLSCGAIGSWNYLGTHTDEVAAAAVLIAGDGNGAFNNAGCDLGRVAIWAFHGALDDVVGPGGSTQPIENLNECDSPAPVEAKITIYPDADHNSWDRTYDGSAGHDIYGWLLGHSKE